MRTCWIEIETVTGSHQEYPNIIGLAYWPELQLGVPCPSGPRYLRIQPVVHMDDQLFGEKPLLHVLDDLNRFAADPDKLQPCVLREGTAPVFAYARRALVDGLEPPLSRNPAEWLLDRSRLSPRQAWAYMLEDLNGIPWDQHRRWTLASFHGAFVLTALGSWLRRVNGSSQEYSDTFNTFYTLDGIALARWALHAKVFASNSLALKAVASSLGISYTHTPEQALTDLKTTQQVVNILRSGVLYDEHQGQRVVSRQVSSEDFA